ncbi:MAG TPA: 50S ribosomal protein L5 [Candidatus Paceibacterota bacterium]|nr:50S ribosomal protein L5 [Candidatus Paceibacterota bacterium]
MKPIKENIQSAFEALKADFNYTNKMQAPRIEKVVISSGVGSIKDKKKIELIADRLGKITGQKPVNRGAKQSIATFKSRQGDLVGYQVTLRGQRMYDFLDRMINIAFPRTRDFRGISADGVDSMGNYSLGIKEHVIFPETADEEIKDVFGLGVTVVTNIKNKEETKAFLAHLGFPFKK